MKYIIFGNSGNVNRNQHVKTVASILTRLWFLGQIEWYFPHVKVLSRGLERWYRGSESLLRFQRTRVCFLDTHLEAHSCPKVHLQGIPHSLLDSVGTACMWYTDIQASKTLNTSNKKKYVFKKILQAFPDRHCSLFRAQQVGGWGLPRRMSWAWDTCARQWVLVEPGLHSEILVKE